MENEPFGAFEEALLIFKVSLKIINLFNALG